VVTRKADEQAAQGTTNRLRRDYRRCEMIMRSQELVFTTCSAVKAAAFRIVLLASFGMVWAIAVEASRPQSASAIEIVVKDVVPDRIERQRAEAAGRLPLPQTPDLSRLDARLAEKGLAAGNDIFLRIFKQESELELWMRQGERYIHFATYPICFFSGSLGPKLREGDKQTPEGIYTIRRRQIHWSPRWPNSFNIGFPNAFDRQNERTGSYILIHGGCSSVGCYAMTDAVLKEIYSLASKTLRGRSAQRRVQLHAFPFRMSEANMTRYRDHRWISFWSDLKAAYDIFEKTRVPPQTGVCDGRYVFAEADADQARNMAIRPLKRREIPPELASRTDILHCPPHSGTATTPAADQEARAPLARDIR